jgi:hypothetical protein
VLINIWLVVRNVDHFVMTIAPASEGIDGSMATVVLEGFSTVSTLRMLLVLLECCARLWATIFPLEDPLKRLKLRLLSWRPLFPDI